MIDLQNGFTAKHLLDDNAVEEFWIHTNGLYPNVAKVALWSLLPFVSIYLCKSGFSTVLIKTAHRNCLKLEDDIRCALSETFPLIVKLL